MSLTNLKKEYTIKSKPKATFHILSTPYINGNLSQKMMAKPIKKYRMNITIPKINRNRLAGDFCLSENFWYVINNYCCNWKKIGMV